MSERRLAAIMFTDIVGYTAMMGRDEEKGLELLRENRHIHKPLIEKYHGKWIKEMGDGILVQFDSAYNAALCAIDIQQTAGKYFKGQLRIGLHIGDIIIENDDIFGDGVNIASRIESLADPGGIYISESIQKELQNHSDIQTKFLGSVELKNVQEQVKIHYVTGHELATPSRKKLKQIQQSKSGITRRKLPVLFLLLILLAISVFSINYWLGNKTDRKVQAIAVLPFANFTGSAEEQYFVDMMHDAVIGELSQIGELVVKSRTSMLQFRNTELTIPEIARKLNVDAIIESSVFKTKDSVLLQVQFIQARPVEDHIWAQDFESDIKNILSLYGKLARIIADEVEIQLSPEEKKRLTNKKEVNPEAYKAYLNGQFHWNKLSMEDLNLAEKYFQKAIEIDPDYAEAYLGLSSIGGGKAQMGLISFAEARLQSDKYLTKALELDSGLWEAHSKLAGYNTWGLWNFKKGLKEFETALQLNPNDAKTRAYYAQAICISFNDYDRAQKEAEYAVQVDPLNNLIKGLYGQTLNFCREYEKAEKIFTEVLDSDPFNAIALSNIKTTYHMQKRYAQAYDVWKTDNRKDSLAVRALESGYKTGGYSGALNALAEYSIQKSSVKFVTPWRIFTIYARAGMKQESLVWLEKAYQAHDPNIPYINTDPIFNFLQDDPKFNDLIQRLSLNK